MEAQSRVAVFIEEHDLAAPPVYRLLDLEAEVGELAKEALESTYYGVQPEGLTVDPDELGDALFSLLALAEALDIDAENALNSAMEKYDHRIDSTGAPSSGE